MSDTRKTTPLWVRLRRGELHPVAVHEHGDGGCDLAEKPTRGDGARGAQHCYWWYRDWHVQTCGCRMCTAYDERKSERRRLRHSKRRAIAEQAD